MNELVLVKTSLWNGENKTDKNGALNLYLQPVAGKMPNKAMVVAGTVAASAGLVENTLQLVMVTEREVSTEYGRQFGVTVLDQNVAGRDIIGLRKELGEAIVVDVTAFEAPKASAPAAPSLATSNVGSKETAATT